MKFSNTFTSLLLGVALIVAKSVSATNQTKEIAHIAVMTLLKVETNISAMELDAIDEGMKATEAEREAALAALNNPIVSPSTRNLRGYDERMLQSCHPCKHVAASFPGCWINGVYVDRCRALQVHEDLSQEEIAELSEDDRRRHLQVAVLCDQAKVGIASVVLEKEVAGVIPVPVGGEFIERCLYSYA